MNKRILSGALALAMVASMGVTAFAANETSANIPVNYVGTGVEEYTVVVPSGLKPGESGTVSVEGTWAPYRELKVTTSDKVVLTNEDSNDTITLGVNYDGLALAGSYDSVVNASKNISVEAIENVNYGDWEGNIVFTISMSDKTGYSAKELNPVIEVFSIEIAGVTYNAESGMTWAEWVTTDYTKGHYFLEGESIKNIANATLDINSINDEIVPNTGYSVK